MNETVTFEKRNNIALITVNNPPVNALSASVRKGISDSVTLAESDSEIEAIVLACSGRTFIAGADITEFGKPMKDPSLPSVLDTIEAINKPIVAALHGTALGGGLEVALTCHYRIAASKTRVGLPEVNLGLLPGAGGTQRLPRIVGIEKALDLIVNGRQMGLDEALGCGLVDRKAEGDLIEDAIAYAAELVSNQAGIRRCSELEVSAEGVSQELFDSWRKKMSKQKRGFEAPLACIDAVELSLTHSVADGMSKERELFVKLMQGTQSGAQRHLFFAQRQAASVKGIDKTTPTREVNSVGVIGAGTMGAGIAINFLNAGIPVKMLELKQDALDRGLKTVSDYYEDRKKKRRMTIEQADQCFKLLEGTLDYSDFGDVDLVIEAVFESMDVKHAVFRKLDEVCKPGAILASNTSTLDIDEIASVTTRPQDVLGLHFFSPAQVMRLLEVIRCEKTADDALATAMQLAQKIKKVGVVSGVCDGFIGNRMLKGYSRETGALLLEGALPPQIDSVIYKFGMAMGPMTMGDLAGLDIGYKVRQARRSRGEHVPAADGAIADRLVDAGRMGQKTGKGYYRYEPNSRTPIPDPEVEDIILKASAELGIERRDISDEEIVERLIYPLINEAALILEEGIAQRPSDIDVVYANGYGFPIYRGGPMYYADTVGLDNVLNAIKKYHERYGDDWKPAPLLVKLVEEGKSFSDL